MAKAGVAVRFLAGCLFMWGGTASAAAPSPADILRFKPRQDNVQYSTPSDQELAGCKVELAQGTTRGSSGWVLKDAKGQILRRFFDLDGDRNLDVWSYYLDGVEVYREIDTDRDRKPDQYRWLNSGGTRWGVDFNGDGKIDGWKMISAEEVGQEVLQAVIRKDPARLQALWITAEDLKALDLPAAEVSRLEALQKQAGAKLQATFSKLGGLTDRARFERLEAGVPHCVLAETLGGRQDLIKHARAAVLYEHNGKHDWLHLGELIQVGAAWRIVDAPSVGDGAEPGHGAVDPVLTQLLEKLRELDSGAQDLKLPTAPGNNPQVVRYNLERADLLEQIVARVKPEEREQWIHQVADCLSAAAQNSPDNDRTAATRLHRLVEQITKAMPGSNLAAYVTFREMSAEYAAQLAKAGQDFVKVQEAWLARLAKFVQDYPKAEDTPDALLQLGMVNEFIGKEIPAKNWYDKLAQDFADHPLAKRAQGALRRLEVEGKPLELSGPLLNGGSFSMGQAAGKIVIVYYWASWNQQCLGDFAKLKLLLNSYASKGVELVCVNLDDSMQQATQFLQSSPAPGIHLHQPGGLESPLGVQYGVMVLPHLFLVNRDGKVVSRTVQVSNLEEEIKKLLK